MNALWVWMTTDGLGIGITSGVVVTLIGAIGVGVKTLLFKSDPPVETTETRLTATGEGSAQAAGKRAVALQSQNGNSVAHTGEGAQTIIQGVPHEDHASLAKQLGITEERLNRLCNTLESLGIAPEEAPSRLPEMVERLKSAENQLENAPKVGGRTDALRQQAETAIAADDLDTAEELLRQAENQDTQVQHQLLDESNARALAVAASAFARGDLAFTRLKYQDAASHFLRAAERTPQSEPREQVTAFTMAGRAYDEVAAFQQAETAYAQARDSAEAHLGANDPLTATVLNNLAALYKDTNRKAQAEPLMERVVSIFEKTYGEEHPMVATALNNLATLYQDTNRMKEAEPLLKRALAIDEKAFGADHPEIATDLNNLAQLYQATNRMEQAEPLMVRALAIDEKAFGADHHKVAIGLNNLAALYQNTNRRTQAEPLMVRALAIDEKAFGADHPEVATDLNNLAQLYKDTNRRTQAEPLMERALAIDEKAFGADHHKVAIHLNNLATLYQDTNRRTQAEPLMERAVRIFTASLGAEHPTTVGVTRNLALLRQKMAEQGE